MFDLVTNYLKDLSNLLIPLLFLRMTFDYFRNSLFNN